MPRKAAPVGAPKASPANSDHRDRLVALRDRLAAAVEEAAHRDLAPLAARYQSVLAELAGLPEAKEGSALDDLAARRARRVPATDRERPAAR